MLGIAVVCGISDDLKSFLRKELRVDSLRSSTLHPRAFPSVYDSLRSSTLHPRAFPSVCESRLRHQPKLLNLLRLVGSGCRGMDRWLGRDPHYIRTREAKNCPNRRLRDPSGHVSESRETARRYTELF